MSVCFFGFAKGARRLSLRVGLGVCFFSFLSKAQFVIYTQSMDGMGIVDFTIDSMRGEGHEGFSQAARLCHDSMYIYV